MKKAKIQAKYQVVIRIEPPIFSIPLSHSKAYKVASRYNSLGYPIEIRKVSDA